MAETESIDANMYNKNQIKENLLGKNDYNVDLNTSTNQEALANAIMELIEEQVEFTKEKRFDFTNKEENQKTINDNLSTISKNAAKILNMKEDYAQLWIEDLYNSRCNDREVSSKNILSQIFDKIKLAVKSSLEKSPDNNKDVEKDNKKNIKALKSLVKEIKQDEQRIDKEFDKDKKIKFSDPKHLAVQDHVHRKIVDFVFEEFAEGTDKEKPTAQLITKLEKITGKDKNECAQIAKGIIDNYRGLTDDDPLLAKLGYEKQTAFIENNKAQFEKIVPKHTGKIANEKQDPGKGQRNRQ